MVSESHVLRIGQVGDPEVSLGLLDASLGEGTAVSFLVHYVVCGGRFHLGLVVVVGDDLLDQRLSEVIGLSVQVGGFVASSRDDEGGPRLIYEDGVHLVHYSEHVSALSLAPEISNHVVAEIIEAHLVVRAVCDVGVVCLLS